jgi:hypothetical protein
MLRRLLPALSFTMALSANLCAAQTPVYKLLYSAPDPSSQGAAPVTMFEASPGLFYFLSTAQGNSAGGPSFGPSIFSLTLANTGSPKLIYSFPFENLSETLVQAANGRLYGGVFNISSTDSFYYSVSTSGQDLRRYLRGRADSLWTMTAAPEGLYDSFGASTSQGGESYGFVRIDENGKVTLLHALSPSEGVPMPATKLALAADGNLYGLGCETNCTTYFIFRLTQSGEYSHLLALPQSYGGPIASPIAASNGSLYGVGGEGANGTGVVYRATLSGHLQAVASFPAKGTAEGMLDPNSLMEASDYALYGSTLHNAIFRYSMATHALTNAYQMNLYNLQGSCDPCQFVQAMDGKLYGTATIGGPGGGAVFSLDFGLPQPRPSVAQLAPASGAPGQQILLWGSHLLGATSVTFNGVPAAAFQVNSTQAVMATVPAGATTGPVTITTANGSVTTKQDFTAH